MDLFIPESWDQPDNPECLAMRAKTRMPDSAQYREKWKIALEQIDLARKDGVPHRAVVADAWYGNIAEFRQGLVERGENYVVGVYATTEVFIEPPVFEEPQPEQGRPGRPRQQPRLIETNPKPIKVSQLGEKVEEDGWEHLELRPDSTGKPLVVKAVSRRVWPAYGYRRGSRHEEVWLVIEKRQLDNGQSELRYFFSNMPQHIPTLEIARVLHERFWIDHGYQQLKEELGLDHHEGRSWKGWYRHVLLVFLAFGYLTRMRLVEKKHQQEILWKKRLFKTLEKENSN
jgi:SRSO17 transposase